MADRNTPSSSVQSRSQTPVRRLLALLRADPRKTALLGALLVVLIVLLIRMAVRPRSASGKLTELLPPAQASSGAGATILRASGDRLDSQKSISTPRGGPHITEPQQITITLPQRDIFALDLSQFPLRPNAEVGSSEPGQRNPELDKLAAARQRVAQLRLQSTVTGPVPTACIDSTMLRLGDSYQGFTIEQITNRRVLLEKDGNRFQLHLSEE